MWLLGCAFEVMRSAEGSNSGDAHRLVFWKALYSSFGCYSSEDTLKGFQLGQG